MGNVFNSISHSFPRILFIFTCVDPYSENGFGSTTLLTTDPIWIRIHNTVLNRYEALQTMRVSVKVKQEAMEKGSVATGTDPKQIFC